MTQKQVNTSKAVLALEEETGRFLAAWMHVRQVVQAANFNRFHRAGLSATQFMILNVIPDEGLTLTQLARKLNLSPASLKITVDSLEDRGLVLRRKSDKDARKVDILNTKEGTRLKNTASGEFHRFMAELFTAMSGTERQGLLTGLERMVDLSPLQNGDNLQELTTPHADAAPQAKRSSRRSVAG
ncbi:MarR family transcriptional regulator (plasmid) [Tunturiibacter empetritectus]|uniref:DNA-binding MarR family transcriptional regulator n=1 Tax=Tunturiibacter lichenicola TaxID=2051959 RepID=A0A852VSJ2_9BACT|nr:DNA-binding MarR family transcriptional regulator [Edaphobacter lichenicola]